MFDLKMVWVCTVWMTNLINHRLSIQSFNHRHRHHQCIVWFWFRMISLPQGVALPLCFPLYLLFFGLKEIHSLYLDQWPLNEGRDCHAGEPENPSYGGYCKRHQIRKDLPVMLDEHYQPMVAKAPGHGLPGFFFLLFHLFRFCLNPGMVVNMSSCRHVYFILLLLSAFNFQFQLQRILFFAASCGPFAAVDLV